MAVLKIYESQVRPQSPKVPNTGALTLPVGLATQYGNALGSIGAVVEKIALENKAEEDANEASDIINNVNQKLSENFNKYSKSSKSGDILNFANDVDNITYEGSNKQVDELVSKYIRKQKNSLSLDLGKKIVSNSVSKSRSRKETLLNSYIMDMTSDDEEKRIFGNRDYNSFFRNPENILFYGEENIKKLKQEKDNLVLKNIYIKRINNNEIDLTDPEFIKKVKEEFGELGAKGLLEKARAITISQVLLDEENEKNEERATVEQQLNNFTKLVDNINTNKTDPSKAKPTIDQIYDLYQIGSLNTAQYNALLKFSVDPERFTDTELLDVINVQIAAARSVSDLDDINAALNEDKNLLDNVDPTQVVEFAKIIDKYKGDVLGLSDYKKYQELLKTHVKDVANVKIRFIDKGDDGSKAREKSINALSEYNRLINLGNTPEDAYLELISQFTEQELPSPEMLPMPIGFELSSVKESLNKNPDNAFDTLYKKAVDKFKKDGNIYEYRENIKRLDLINDVFKVRETIFGDDDYLGKFKIKKKKAAPPKKKGFLEKIGEKFEGFMD